MPMAVDKGIVVNAARAAAVTATMAAISAAAVAAMAAFQAAAPAAAPAAAENMLRKQEERCTVIIACRGSRHRGTSRHRRVEWHDGSSSSSG